MGFFTASWVVNHASHGNGEMAFQCLLDSFFHRFATHTPKLRITLHLYYMCVSTSRKPFGLVEGEPTHYALVSEGLSMP